jgi:hypothetical protein
MNVRNMEGNGMEEEEAAFIIKNCLLALKLIDEICGPKSRLS